MSKTSSGPGGSLNDVVGAVGGTKTVRTNGPNFSFLKSYLELVAAETKRFEQAVEEFFKNLPS